MKFLTALTFIGITVASLTSMIHADEIELPLISKPAILDEGTQRGLSDAQINELLPWAKNSKIYLIDLLDNIQGLTAEDKVERLTDGIKTVVGDSAPKSSELLMRYTLNRGLVINDILNKQMDANAVGSVDAKLRVLKSTIDMAIKYYEIDLAILTKKSVAPFVIFGLDYFEFLSELNKSIFDASAQYNIQRTALEWLQWDLYRDVNNASYASQIVKINNSLKTFPTKQLSDSQSIANIRLMKKVSEQLQVKSTLKRLEEARKIAEASNEEERRLLVARSEAERITILKELEIEKLRGSRSALDIERFRVYSMNISSSDWTKRLEAVKVLNGIIGGDITVLFLKRWMSETDADVANALIPALRGRIANPSYVMKAESLEGVNTEVYQYMVKVWSGVDWKKREYIVGFISRYESLETYKVLLAWMQVETDADVKRALTNAISALEKKIK